MQLRSESFEQMTKLVHKMTLKFFFLKKTKVKAENMKAYLKKKSNIMNILSHILTTNYAWIANPLRKLSVQFVNIMNKKKQPLEFLLTPESSIHKS